MEFSAKVTRIARILLAVFLAALGGVLWLESRSQFSAALRMNQPWVFWLEIDTLGPEPCYALAIYQPQRRLFDLIHVLPKAGCLPTGSINANKLMKYKDYGPILAAEEDSLLAEIPTVNSQRPLPSLYVPIIPMTGAFLREDPLEEAEALRSWTEGLGFWRYMPKLFRGEVSSASTMPLIDRLLLAIELHRIPPENLRAAWLPESEEQRRFFFGNIFAPPSETRSSGHAVAVDVLNASRRAGIASTATDV